MNEERLISVLHGASKRLRRAGLPAELAERVEALAKQVRQPCVVAVVGRVKVGKSTFVNALLGEDLAKVGTTETTATINYFTFGHPDPDRRVRCHWRGGKVTEESTEFLDGLQGNDLETLRRADGIDHLEYLLPNPLLRQITLVDTPGTGAVVDEHQDRTAEFLQLNSQLRDRHDQDTRRLGDTADAVIYLVGQVARVSDRAFLHEFAETTGGRSSALNAIGVLSKIELQPEVLARRGELSAKIASQLEDSLNVVIPVAAGARRALDQLLGEDGGGMRDMIDTLRRIPPDTLRVLLDSEEFFCDLDFPDSPVGADERRRLLGDMKWGVFAMVARVAADAELDMDEVVQRIEQICGFEPLWEVLRSHFIERGHILRAYRIASEAQAVLNGVRYTEVPRLRKDARRSRGLLNEFLEFIHGSEGDRETAEELEEFVRSHLDVDRRVHDLEVLHGELDAELGGLLVELLDYNADFQALQRLEAARDDFSAAELAELRPLLGLYGGEVAKRLPPGAANAEYVGWRQMYWGHRRTEVAYDTFEHSVAVRAYTRYGLILDEILGDSGA